MAPLLLLAICGSTGAEEYTQFPKLTRDQTAGKGPLIEEVSAVAPHAWLVHNLLSPEQCQEVREQAQGRLAAPSTIGNFGSENVNDEVRRATTTPLGYVPWDKDEIHEHLHSYVSKTLGFDSSHIEMLFVNQYNRGGFYKKH